MVIKAKHPFISIIIVVRNGKATIGEALASVSRQCLRELELIVVDGASTDGTVDIITASSGAISKWISEPDNGVYDAMHKGVRLATGDWVYFLGSDDVLCANLNEIVPHLQDRNVLYYGNVLKVGEGVTYDGKFGPWKLLRRNICQQAIFYPRHIFDTRQFNLAYPQLADWEFNLRCFADPALVFEYLPVTIARYNDVSGSSATLKDHGFARDQGRIIRECLPFWCYAWHCVKFPSRFYRSQLARMA